MKKNTIKITEEGAMVSKAFEKKANIYGTAEYRMWREFKSENPGMKMITSDITREPNKNKGWTYEKMEQFIKTYFGDTTEHLDNFNKMKNGVYFNTTAYKATTKWFHANFENTEQYKTACGEEKPKTTQEPNEEKATA